MGHYFQDTQYNNVKNLSSVLVILFVCLSDLYLNLFNWLDPESGYTATPSRGNTIQERSNLPCL